MVVTSAPYQVRDKLQRESASYCNGLECYGISNNPLLHKLFEPNRINLRPLGVGGPMRLLVSPSRWIVIKGFLFLLPILFTDAVKADCAEEVYYSIHVQSFKNLTNANRYVNGLRNKGKIVFWMELLAVSNQPPPCF